MYGVPDNIHRNIILSSNLFVLSTLFSVVNLYFTWGQLDALHLSLWPKIGVVFCSYMISLIIAWIVRLGKSWIRMPLLILTLLGSILSIPQLLLFFTTSLWAGLISLLQLSTQLYAAIILYKPETSEWYKRKKWEKMF